MEILIEQAISSVFQKDTVFFGLFLVGYYMQYIDKKEQKDFIKEQQGVLVRLTRSVERIDARGEKHEARLERIENTLTRKEN